MPLKPEDYEAIRNLYGRYSIAIDTGDIDAVVACFAPDGSVEYGGLPEGLGRNRPHVGHDAIRALSTDVWAGTQGHVLHLQHIQTISGDGDQAHVAVYGVVLRRGQAPYSGVILTETAEDTLVRTETGWVYKTRVGKMDSHASTPASTDVLVVSRDEFIDAARRH